MPLSQQELDRHLLEAAQDCDEDQILEFLGTGANPNVVDEETGKTPLMFICDEGGMTEAIQALLKAGGPKLLEIKDNEGQTAFDIFASGYRPQEEDLRVFLDSMSDHSSISDESIKALIGHSSHPECIALLDVMLEYPVLSERIQKDFLDKLEDIAEMSYVEALHESIYSGLDNQYKLLMNSNVDIDFDYKGDLHPNGLNTALHLAVYVKNLEIVKELVEIKKVSLNLVNKDGLTPLDMARKRKQKEIEEYLVKKGAISNPNPVALPEDSNSEVSEDDGSDSEGSDSFSDDPEDEENDDSSSECDSD